jgi:Tol biopolymer transport system component
LWTQPEQADGIYERRRGLYVSDSPGRTPRHVARGSIWSAAWSPRGTQLAYELGVDRARGALWVTRSDGGRRMRLGRSDGGGVAWAPSGRQLAFARRARGDSADIWVTSAEGRLQRNISTDPAHDFAPRWSPDGRRIAFLRANRPDGDDADRELWIMTADGSDQRKLADASEYPPFAWSARGENIAFTRAESQELMVVSPRGDRPRRVAGPIRPHIRGFEWSPDGGRIAFDSSSIFVTAVAAGDVTRVTQPGTGSNYDPTWSPTGRRLAFVRDWGLHTIGVDGTRPRRLTGRRGRFDSCDYRPKWSPGGRRIAFMRDRDCEGGPGDIWVINGDGTRAVNASRRLGSVRPYFLSWEWQPRPER